MRYTEFQYGRQHLDATGPDDEVEVGKGTFPFILTSHIWLPVNLQKTISRGLPFPTICLVFYKGSKNTSILDVKINW